MAHWTLLLALLDLAAAVAVEVAFQVDVRRQLRHDFKRVGCWAILGFGLRQRVLSHEGGEYLEQGFDAVSAQVLDGLPVFVHYYVGDSLYLFRGGGTW